MNRTSSPLLHRFLIHQMTRHYDDNHLQNIVCGAAEMQVSAVEDKKLALYIQKNPELIKLICKIELHNRFVGSERYAKGSLAYKIKPRQIKIEDYL